MRSVSQDHKKSSSPALGQGADATVRAARSSERGVSISFVRPSEKSDPAVNRLSVGETRARRDAVPRAIAAATSWLLAAIIEGFAAYGEALCPGVADPWERSDRDELTRHSQRHASTQDGDRDGVVPLYADGAAHGVADQVEPAPAAQPCDAVHHRSRADAIDPFPRGARRRGA